MTSGCEQCHSIGKPNDDGTIGNCTACHTRHTSSVAIARQPRTCGHCHLGPDHSQIEIYEESKHGVMFSAQKELLNLNVEPKKLTTREMFVPTCATCHMSGINGLGMTHDPSERLSYFLANAISAKRPNYAQAQAKMKQVCNQCHTPEVINRVYAQAEQVVQTTNNKVNAAKTLMDGLRADGTLSGPPFSNPIDFVYFDFWHYDGRTSKHGAFMGGSDFVQWHGNYPMLKKTVELQSMAAELRKQHDTDKLGRWLEPWLLLEVFILFNLGFLTLDIYLAHSINSFRESAEYIPFYFSACAPVILLIGLVYAVRRRTLWKIFGHTVGWIAILVGLAGVLYHLHSCSFMSAL